MTHITLTYYRGYYGYNPYYYYSAPMRNYRKSEANSVYRGQNLHRNNSSNWNNSRIYQPSNNNGFNRTSNWGNHNNNGSNIGSSNSFNGNNSRSSNWGGKDNK